MTYESMNSAGVGSPQDAERPRRGRNPCPQQELSPRLVTLDSHRLAIVLNKTAASVQSDLSRAPHRLPPHIQIPGGTVLWRQIDVDAWLEQLATNRRPGRPTKVAQARRAAAGLSKSTGGAE